MIKEQEYGSKEDGMASCWSGLFAADIVRSLAFAITFDNSCDIGWPGDNFYFVWLIEWYARTLLQGRNPFGSVQMFNYPEGWNIAYNEPTPAMTVPFCFLGGILGYNISPIVSFVLSGVLTYLDFGLTSGINALRLRSSEK